MIVTDNSLLSSLNDAYFPIREETYSRSLEHTSAPDILRRFPYDTQRFFSGKFAPCIFFPERLDLEPNFLDDALYHKTISYSVLLLVQVSSFVSNASYYIVLSSTVKFISISIKKNKNKIRPFQLLVNPAFNYLIHFTVRKTCIDFVGLRISRKATFHCIAIWVFNWNSK